MNTPSLPIQPDVRPRRMMDQRAAGNEIKAKAGHLGERLNRHAAARFRAGAVVHEGDRFHQRIEGKIVEQDDIHARFEHRWDLLQRIHFTFDERPGQACAGLPHGGGEAFTRAGVCGGEVVVLDQHAVKEAQPVVPAPAAGHRVLFQHAEAGRGLARVEQLGVGPAQRRDILGRLRRDAGKLLEKIQRRALGFEQGGRRADDRSQHVALVCGLPIAHTGRDLEGAVIAEAFKHQWQQLQAANGQRLAGDKRRARWRRIDQCRRGDIAGRDRPRKARAG